MIQEDSILPIYTPTHSMGIGEYFTPNSLGEYFTPGVGATLRKRSRPYLPRVKRRRRVAVSEYFTPSVGEYFQASAGLSGFGCAPVSIVEMATSPVSSATHMLRNPCAMPSAVRGLGQVADEVIEETVGPSEPLESGVAVGTAAVAATIGLGLLIAYGYFTYRAGEAIMPHGGGWWALPSMLAGNWWLGGMAMAAGK